MKFLLSNWPVCLLILCALLIGLYLLRKSNNIIDMRDIISNHFDLLKEDLFTIVVFIFVPIISSMSCAFLRCVTADIINNINISLSIFIALQFAIAGILCSIPAGNNAYEKIKKQAFNEILFECVLTILSLVLSFAILFVGINKINTIVLLIISAMLYCLVFNTVMNIFIVLKRLKLLFDER